MENKLRSANLSILIAAAVMLVGTFLPCYSILGIGVSGIEGFEGIVVLFAAIAVAVLTILGKDKFTVIPGAISAIILIKLCFDLFSIGFGNIGIGIFFMWIGTIAAIALPFIPAAKKK